MTPPEAQRHQRQRLFVNRNLQSPFVGLMLFVLLIMVVGASAAVYFTLWATLKSFRPLSDPSSIAILTTVGLLLVLEVLIVAPLIFMAGLYLTNRVAGPLVRIKAALEEMSRGNFDVRLKLRKGDLMDDVAERINSLADSLRQRKE